MVNSRFLISSAFAFMLVLMVALLGVSLVRLHNINDDLNTIAYQHDIKLDQILTMRDAARERAMLLHRLVVENDPFEKDSLVQKISEMAGMFIGAREKLMSGPLDNSEKENLNQALKYANMGGQAQEGTINLVLAGKQAEASEMLLTRVIPIQNQVLAEFSAILAAQREADIAAVKKANKDFHFAVALMVFIGLSVLGTGLVLSIYVIRRTTRIEQDLIAEKLRAQLTLHSIGDAIVTTNPSGQVTYLNQVAQNLSGWAAEEAQGKAINEVIHLFSSNSVHPLFASNDPAFLSQATAEHDSVAKLISRHGQESSIEYHVSPILDGNGHTSGHVIVLHDVTQSTELSKKLSWAANHDALTGLINRTEFERRLEALLLNARMDLKEHALLYLDLDQFKVVNDTCGHMAGDDLLRQLAVQLEGQIRHNDTLARLGGDEFGILLQGCTLDRAADVAEHLRDAVKSFRFAWQDKVFDIGVSIGLVPINYQSESAPALLSAVDSACYAAKDLGRNQVHIFEPGDEELARRKGEMHWAQQVSQAIDDGRMALYFQKIVPISARNAGQTHVELLIRMLDENGKLVPPMAFIPAAERYNMMGTLDRWVVQTVFQRLAARSDKENTVCAINLSGQSVSDKQMLEFILDQFQQTGVSPQHICFEITETAAIANLRSALAMIDTLRAMGCRFSLDDFGSGMSSFGYLRQLKVDYLKIDGSFVRQMLSNPTDHTMVEAINNIGHVMGIQTIAECVETPAMLDALKKMGVDYAQGFGIHRPEPLSARDEKASA